MARLLCLICVLLTACIAEGKAKFNIQNADHPGRVASQYLVSIKADDPSRHGEIMQKVTKDGELEVMNRFNFGKLSVFLIHSNDESAVASLMSIPGVLSVEADVREYVLACVDQDLTGIDGLWNLVRTNVREAGGPEVYTYQEGDGEGTTAYVLDTGIFLEHNDFGGRASHGYTAPPYDVTEGDRDLHGHGTHCSGTVAGSTYGAAKNAALISVKVVDRFGRGQISECIGGLEWVFNDFSTKDEAAGGQFKAVISMSLGYSRNQAMDLIIQELFDIGLLTVAAAMNARTEACVYSPAGADASIAVAASDNTDTLASFTNFGVCVDIIAPGVDILSAGHFGPDATAVFSGTSMATPLVAGVVLRHMSQLENRPPPEAIRSWLAQTSTKDAIDLSGHDTTPNNFLYAPCNVQ